MFFQDNPVFLEVPEKLLYEHWTLDEFQHCTFWQHDFPQFIKQPLLLSSF